MKSFSKSAFGQQIENLPPHRHAATMTGSTGRDLSGMGTHRTTASEAGGYPRNRVPLAQSLKPVRFSGFKRLDQFSGEEKLGGNPDGSGEG